MEFLITMIILSIICIIINWIFIHKAYSKGGRWEGSEPEIKDLLFTFLPVINIAVTVAILLLCSQSKKFLYKVFLIKK